MEWFTLFAIPIIAILAWLYTVTVANSKFPKLRNKRICLLIAHPDDEAMFFAPSILALTEPSLGNHVKILCLSSGMFCVSLCEEMALLPLWFGCSDYWATRRLCEDQRQDQRQDQG